MLFAGFGMLQGMTASNTIIQTLVPEDKRGRVMSYYTAAFVGMAPFGQPAGGGDGALDRRAADGDVHGVVLHCGRGLVLDAAAGDSAGDAAGLRATGDHHADTAAGAGAGGELKGSRPEEKNLGFKSVAGVRVRNPAAEFDASSGVPSWHAERRCAPEEDLAVLVFSFQ